jgi:hypothetical protein
MQSSRALPSAMSWVFAAIVLVLHWAAFGTMHFRFAAGGAGTVPAFTSGGMSAWPAVAPRPLPPTVSFETSSRTDDDGRGRTGDKPYALLPSTPRVAEPGDGYARFNVHETAPRAFLARVYDPRAPPRLIAI